MRNAQANFSTTHSRTDVCSGVRKTSSAAGQSSGGSRPFFRGGGAGAGEVALDANALIDKFERPGTFLTRLESAIGTRKPVVSPIAAVEFIKGPPMPGATPEEVAA